jgi:hypothetical protein
MNNNFMEQLAEILVSHSNKLSDDLRLAANKAAPPLNELARRCAATLDLSKIMQGLSKEHTNDH